MTFLSFMFISLEWRGGEEIEGSSSQRTLWVKAMKLPEGREGVLGQFQAEERPILSSRSLFGSTHLWQGCPEYHPPCLI